MTDTTKTDDKIKPRTIVGSHPHRRQLPEGREALERAIEFCERWESPTPRFASLEAVRAAKHPCWAVRAGWLPMDYRMRSVRWLRREHARLLREVAP